MAEKIPGEIWQDIINLVKEGNDIKSCSLVCRSWYAIASEILWNKKPALLQPSKVSSLMVYLDENPEFAGKIKYLGYDGTCLEDKMNKR